LFGSEATACYLLSIKQLLASKKKNNKTVAGFKEEKKTTPLPALAWISNPIAISILWANSLSY